MSEEKLVFAQNYIDGKFEDGPQFLDSFNPVKYDFVNLKSNSALLYKKGHNFWKVFWPEKFTPIWIFPY